jgi:hypothetical protein
MLTTEELDVVICADLAAIHTLLQLDVTVESFRESLRSIARAVEREAYKRAAAECRRLGGHPIWIASAYHCAEAIEALGSER